MNLKSTCLLLLLIVLSPLADVHATPNVTSDFNVDNVNSVNYYQSSLLDKYDINYLKLDLNVAPGTNFISGSCLYKITATQPIDTFAIEFRENMTLDSVKINNVVVNYTRANDHIYVAFNTPVAAGTQLVPEFFYSGIVIHGLGYGRDTTNNLFFAATVSESFQAREWFPAKQLLNDKIDSADIWLTTPDPYVAGTNGLLKAIVPVAGGKRQFQWSTRYPMSYYMPCFATGNYMDYRNYAKPAAMAGDSILIQHLLVDNPVYFNKVKVELDKTPIFIEKFSELFGLYPFRKEKYGHLHALIGGGMEHQTMSTMSGFTTGLISHELAHQWFGDNVTCGSWRDIWLNEGFATYGAYLMIEMLPSLHSYSAAGEMNNVHRNVMSQAGGSVYISAASAYNEGRIFSSRLSYDKASAVLHNLRFELQSDSVFFNILKTYQQRFKDSFALTTDFITVAEQVSGKNLDYFFSQWIYGQGFPTYDVGYYKWGADTLVLNVIQATSMPAITPLFQGLMQYKITSAQGDTIITVNQTANTQTFKIPYKKVPDDVIVDPNNWVINAAGSVLPVKLISFTGTTVNKEARLKWLVSGEKNIHHYEVQRSADGAAFETLGNSYPMNNNNEYQYYFTDRNPLVIGYYRLKIVDIDGSFSYSNIVELKVSSSEIKIKYNRALAILTVDITTGSAGKAQVNIHAIDGKKIQQSEKSLQAGATQTVLNLSNLAIGIYVVEVTTGNERKTLKIKR